MERGHLSTLEYDMGYQDRSYAHQYTEVDFSALQDKLNDIKKQLNDIKDSNVLEQAMSEFNANEDKLNSYMENLLHSNPPTHNYSKSPKHPDNKQVKPNKTTVPDETPNYIPIIIIPFLIAIACFGVPGTLYSLFLHVLLFAIFAVLGLFVVAALFKIVEEASA